jgi:hypothetical protein
MFAYERTNVAHGVAIGVAIGVVIGGCRQGYDLICALLCKHTTQTPCNPFADQ